MIGKGGLAGPVVRVLADPARAQNLAITDFEETTFELVPMITLPQQGNTLSRVLHLLPMLLGAARLILSTAGSFIALPLTLPLTRVPPSPRSRGEGICRLAPSLRLRGEGWGEGLFLYPAASRARLPMSVSPSKPAMVSRSSRAR